MVLWVFGYGSLIWNPSFKYDERVVGYIRDYKRAFHQACIDYRGTVERPGRTLTLEPHEGAVTWGVAYRVTAEVEREMCLAYLDRRERTYDEKAMLDFYTEFSGNEPYISGGVLTYIATLDSSNLWYLGPAPMKRIAAQISRSYGPAGSNYEYLFRLEESLLQIGAHCVGREIAQLANEVRRLVFRPRHTPRTVQVQHKIRRLIEMPGIQIQFSVRRVIDRSKSRFREFVQLDYLAEPNTILRRSHEKAIFRLIGVLSENSRKATLRLLCSLCSSNCLSVFSHRPETKYQLPRV